MTHCRVRVKDGRVIAGYTHDGARRRVMPGDYEARWISIARGQDPTLRAALRVFGADNRGGDLDVLREEYVDDLDDFPNLSDESKFEILVVHD
ncbi:hypothetical protein [Burkholderia ubonensis]|uniref:hypothetical protein n=1 Tax=Burkholderia ubonensis TaxID=101571 RepID=UPI000AAE374F|nr:hypothetical protein [Burkholderia ubonensis]